MDLGATVVGIAIIVLCCIPFILISRNSRRRKQALLQGLNDFAKKNNGQISRSDIWNKSAIGIDDTSHRIFFTKETKEGEVRQMIPLAEVQKCRVATSGRITGQTAVNHKVIEKLELVFTHSERKTTETVLEFYSIDSDSLTLTGELQLAEKWCKMINDDVTARSQRK
ncbi:MAG: hypothetical protein U0X91_27345 [Spirosomataceae bacterium]